VRRVTPSSKTKFAHLIQITHRDQVESPITDWLREAYDYSDALTAKGTTATAPKPTAKRAGPRKKKAPPKRKNTRKTATKKR